MINLLRQGMDCVISRQSTDGWEVVTRQAGRTILEGQAAWLAERYILKGHGIRIMFLDRPLPRFVLPSISDVRDMGEWGDPAEWPAEYHALLEIWKAAMIESARQLGLSADEAISLVEFVLTHKWDEYPSDVKDFLLEIPHTKTKLYRFLVEGTGDQLWIDSLFEKTQLDRKSLVAAFRKSNTPIVYLPLPADWKDIALAQMCIWAYRQGMKDNTLLKHIQRTVAGIIKDQDAAWDIAETLREQWSAPLYRGSFAEYVHRRHKELGLKKTWVDPKTGEMKYGSAVAQISQQIGCAPQTIYNYMTSGKISGCKTSRQATEQEMITRKEYALDEDVVSQARDAYKASKGRAAIVKIMVKQLGVTIRTAQRKVKERIEAGETLDIIVKDIDHEGHGS